jgi:cleavage and polyadenylation specificity factor subunit 1
MVMEAPLFRTKLQVEPSSRCAALSLPKDSIAILPFYQTQADLDVMDQDQYQARWVSFSRSADNPYSFAPEMYHTPRVSF